MMKIRRATERGVTKTEWLESYHTFSFNNYYDPSNMGFSDLRVINDDVVKGGTGFGTHSHRDMEIITYVLKGVVQHRDSTGGSGLIRAGEVQRMTAGTGVSHSEFNGSKDEDLHLYQIWILPERTGLKPGYEQKSFRVGDNKGSFQLIASPAGNDGALKIHQDASLFAAQISEGQTATYAVPEGRKGWLQIASGSVDINGETLRAGDGAAISDESTIAVLGRSEAEVLLFDLR